MKTKSLMIAISLFALVMGMTAAADAASVINMTIASKTVPKNIGASIPITVSNTNAIAGAVFTLVYDTTSLDISIDSTFFDTFAVQSAEAKAAGYTGMSETSVTVDGITYDQPIMENIISGTGMKIAAARALPAAAGLTTPLFILHVRLKSGATPKAYTISVVPTQYTLDGSNSNLNLVIGSDLSKAYNSPDAYPVKLDATDYANYVTGGTVTFSSYMAGDADGSGTVNAVDLLKYKSHILNKTLLTGDALTRADINGDGKVNAVDLLKLKLLILNKNVEL